MLKGTYRFRRANLDKLRHEGRCYYCGITAEDYGQPHQADHMIPRSRGGGNDFGNLVPACKTCNTRKQTKTIEEFRAYLIEKGGTEVVFWGELESREGRDWLFVCGSLLHPFQRRALR